MGSFLTRFNCFSCSKKREQKLITSSATSTSTLTPNSFPYPPSYNCNNKSLESYINNPLRHRDSTDNPFANVSASANKSDKIHIWKIHPKITRNPSTQSSWSRDKLRFYQHSRLSRQDQLGSFLFSVWLHWSLVGLIALSTQGCYRVPHIYSYLLSLRNRGLFHHRLG